MAMNDKDSKALLEEMQAIKKLLILQLLGNGFKQKQIAAMLGISEPTMSRLMPPNASKLAITSGKKGADEGAVGQ